MTTFVAQTATAGANLNGTETTQRHKLGETLHGSNGTIWIYVQASGAISAGDLVTITTANVAARGAIADAMTGLRLGFAQNAFADTEYGWVALSGNPLLVNVSATSTLNVALYIGTGTGHVSTSTGSATLAGIAFVSANASTAVVAMNAIVSWPRLRIDGLS